MYSNNLNRSLERHFKIYLNIFIIFLLFASFPLSAQNDAYNSTNIKMHPDASVGIYGSWTENGVFRNNRGSVYFNGIYNKKQNFDGPMPVDFEFLELNNSKGLYTNLYIGITRLLNFNKGIIHTSRINPNFLVDFLNNATYKNVADDRHIDGYVAKTVRDTFAFPIGDEAEFRPAIITNLDTRLISSIACYFRGSPNTATLPTGAPFNTTQKEDIIQQVSTIEYWHIKGDAPVTVTLTWNQKSQIATLTNSDLNRLTIVSWNGARWINLGVINEQGDLKNGRITSRAVVPDSFFVFTFALAQKDVRCFTSVNAVKIKGNNIVCNGKSIPLDAGTGFKRYKWSTGEETKIINVNTAGKYYVFAWDSCDVAHSDTILVKTLPSVKITTRNTTCYGRSDGAINFLSDVTGMTITVNNVTVTPDKLKNLSATSYSVHIESPKFCPLDTVIIIKEPALKPIKIISDSLIVFEGSTVKLSTKSTDTLYNPKYWQWLPPDIVSCINCPTTTAKIERETIFKVLVLDSLGCSASDEITIKVNKDDRYALYVPNIFKPEKEEYTVLGNPSKVHVLKMQIFDRWGALIFEASDFAPDGSVTWDGTFRGKQLSLGTFAVIVEAQFIDGTRKKYARDLVLVR